MGQKIRKTSRGETLEGLEENFRETYQLMTDEDILDVKGVQTREIEVDL
jgi:hypothetical protein